MDYLNDPFAILPVDTTPPEHRSQTVTFTYTPWTPPAKPATGSPRPGQQPKPNIHEQAVRDNIERDVWFEFPVSTAGTNPEDPYDGNLSAHSRDIYRSARTADLNVSVQFYKILPDGTEERWLKTKDKTDYMDDGLAAIIRFKARRKKTI